MLNLAELNHRSRLELVQWHFLKGFSYKEIIMFLSNQHGIDISWRQLYWLLRQQNLYRRHHKDTINVVLEAIKADIDGPSTNLDYRSIYQKLIHNGIKTDRETVRPCLKTIDPAACTCGMYTVMIKWSLLVSPFTEQLTVSAGKSCGLIYVLLTKILTLLVTSM